MAQPEKAKLNITITVDLSSSSGKLNKTKTFDSQASAVSFLWDAFFFQQRLDHFDNGHASLLHSQEATQLSYRPELENE